MKNPSESTCPKCGALIPEEAPQGLCPACVLSSADTVPDSPNSGARSTPPSAEELAAAFPDLEVLELIGAGGMGAVYKARQPKLDRIVALKILSRDLSADPAFAERFNREARVLARLNHPNIVTVFDFGTQGPFCFLLMEYVDGVNLRQAMRAGRFTPTESLAMVQDICAALRFAHEDGILHRDIKPENVLIDARGRVKIADFGIAKLIAKDGREDFTLTQHGAVLGSPHYMAPEQIETPADVDQRADIYSLGVVFYELLTGELPIGRFAPPSERTPMDARIDEIVMRTLEKERQARYQSVGEVQTGVENLTRTGDAGKLASSFAAPAPHAGEESGTRKSARFATASAVITGLSLILAMVCFAVWKSMASIEILPGARGSYADARNSYDAYVGMIAAVFLGVVGLVALSGIILGSKALGEIRDSGGRKRGYGSAMFGVWTWPVIALLALVQFFVPKTMQGPEERTPSSSSSATNSGGVPESDVSRVFENTWQDAAPDVTLEVNVPKGKSAKIDMVRTDASGREFPFGLDACIVASDREDFTGYIGAGAWRRADTTEAISQIRSTIESLKGGFMMSYDHAIPGEADLRVRFKKLDLTDRDRFSVEIGTIRTKQEDGSLGAPETLSLVAALANEKRPGAPFELADEIIGSGKPSALIRERMEQQLKERP